MSVGIIFILPTMTRRRRDRNAHQIIPATLESIDYSLDIFRLPALVWFSSLNVDVEQIFPHDSRNRAPNIQGLGHVQQ